MIICPPKLLALICFIIIVAQRFDEVLQLNIKEIVRQLTKCDPDCTPGKLLRELQLFLQHHNSKITIKALLPQTNPATRINAPHALDLIFNIANFVSVQVNLVKSTEQSNI